MDPIAVGVAAALGQGLFAVGKKLLTDVPADLVKDPIRRSLQHFVERRAQPGRRDQALLDAVRAAAVEAGAEAEDDDAIDRWLRDTGLARLTAPQNSALRRQAARAVLTFTNAEADPPEELMIALGWPRRQRRRLAQFLVALRARLFDLEEWQAPVAYANQALAQGAWEEIARRLARLDALFVQTEAGEALRAVIVEQGLSEDAAAQIEEKYRDELVRNLRWHDFRGITQVKQDVRLPLADIYLELGLLPLGDDEKRRHGQEEMTALREIERLAAEERRLQDRVTDALAKSQRLVILGEPGAGKTISLHFIALMLAYGYGANRLGLEAPYLPILVRLADFARALEQKPALSLDNFLIEVVQQAHSSDRRLGDLIRLALEKGGCMILLDGLDEVGDDPLHGQPLRTRVVQRVQKLADQWCADDRCNRLVVTSRIEGYWGEPLRDFDHVQISPLRPPEEIEEFLLRWYTAHEQAHDKDLSVEQAEGRARQRVAELLPRIVGAPGVLRLATNPLLLTILALIHENVGKLPNRRIKLYEFCAQTLIESWRQAQVGMPSALLEEMGEEKVIRVMAPLAYWLHEERPGGTAAYEEWRARLTAILREEGYEREAAEIANRFLHFARQEAGLLAERGLGRFGFFHLTFEEYLAAREIAWQRAEKRREMLRAHWEDARWQEVILLAAGQLGIADTRRDDVSDFLEDLLSMEPADPANMGRQAVLAGRALADIGARSVTNQTRRWVMEALRQTMEDRNPETGQFNDAARFPLHTRYAAGEVLDELGWLPDDLNAWVRCPGCADDGRDLLVMKYPVTNVQFERFILARGYEEPGYWGGKQGAGWRWRVIDYPSYRGSGPVHEPEYWRSARFGHERRGYPVVGVSWYEAAAYAAWLSEVLRRARAGDPDLAAENRALVADLLAAGADEVRLPTAEEWERVAGGVGRDQERYPWDDPRGPATRDSAAILARANTTEAGLNGTSPVAMYPQGASQPFGLMDLAGNVWEWTDSWYGREGGGCVLRGGSWHFNQHVARCAFRHGGCPDLSNNLVGFRVVSPIVPGP